MGLVNELADDPETLVAECLQRSFATEPSRATHSQRKLFTLGSKCISKKGLMRAEEIYREYSPQPRMARKAFAHSSEKNAARTDWQVSESLAIRASYPRLMR